MVFVWIFLGVLGYQREHLSQRDMTEQQKVKKALRLQAIAMNFTEEAFNNMTRGLTDANPISVMIKAKELQEDA